MSIITDCTPVVITIASRSVDTLIEQLSDADITIASNPLEIIVSLSHDDSVAVSSSYTEHFVSLDTVDIAVAASDHSFRLAVDLANVRIGVSSQEVIVLTTLDIASSVAQSSQVTTESIIDVSNAPIVADSTALQQQLIVALGKASIGVASSYFSHFVTLSISSIAVSSAALQQQKFTDLGIASSVAVGASILDLRTWFDLASVGIEVNSLDVSFNIATDLGEADLCIDVRVFDEHDTNTMIWTCNTDEFSMSRYPVKDIMLSVATGPSGTFYGSEGGLYHQNGAVDAWGNGDIDSMVVTGLTDFGSPYLERGDKLYLLYRSTAGVRVDVGVTGSGDEITYTYSAPDYPFTAMKQVRVEMGRGAVSRMWRFTVRNTEGKPLSLRGFLADLLDTTRRM